MDTRSLWRKCFDCLIPVNTFKLPTPGRPKADRRVIGTIRYGHSHNRRWSISKAGVDIVTDGEVRRENYIHDHCRHLDGMDFAVLTEKHVRGVYSARLPTITAPVRAREPLLPHDRKTSPGAERASR